MKAVLPSMQTSTRQPSICLLQPRQRATSRTSHQLSTANPTGNTISSTSRGSQSSRVTAR